MSKKNNKFNIVEKIFLGSALFMVVIIFITIFFSFRFLSDKISEAFFPPSDTQPELKFDIEGYNKLGI